MSKESVSLNTWIPNNGKFPEYISEYILTVFDDYIDENGKGTCSIKFKFKNGEVKGWYHPPMLEVQAESHKQYRWKV